MSKRDRQFRSAALSLSQLGTSQRKKKKTGPSKKKGRNAVASSMSRSTFSMPANYGTTMVRQTARTHVESFTDYFIDVTASAAPTAGDMLVNVPQILRNFGVRVAALATLYQKWRFRRCAFRYVSEVPTSSAGSLTMAHVCDMNYSIPAAFGSATNGIPGGIRSLMNEISGAKTFPVWTPEIRMSVPCKKEWLYTSGLNASGIVANLVANGTLLVAANSVLATANQTYGRIYVDAEIEFSEPDYNLAAGVASFASYVVTPTNTSGTTPMVLTLKSASATLITAPFAIWIPAADTTIGDAVLLQNSPQFLAYNVTSSGYNIYSSPQDYNAGGPLVSAASTGTTPITGATLYFPANF